jgi:hypothetical protein
MYLQHFMLIFQTESGFSKKRCSDVQDWGQVCRFQGKNCGGFGAFTRSEAILSKMTSLTFLTHQLVQIKLLHHSLLPIRRPCRLDDRIIPTYPPVGELN